MAIAPVLRGDGFTLRALSVSDAETWRAGEDIEQIRWMGAPGPASMENVLAAIHRWQADWAEDGPVRQWGIWSNDRLVGGVELRIRDDGRANISYVVFPRWRKQGIASGAVRTASVWALGNLGVSAVVAIVDEDNLASRRVAERAGFSLHGRAERWEYSEGGVMLRYCLSTLPNAAVPE